VKQVILICAFIVFVVAATRQSFAQQAQAAAGDSCRDASARIDGLTGETIALFKANKFDEAFAAANKAFELTNASCPSDKTKRLAAAMNVAEIQLKREKIEEARTIFKENLPLAESVYGENSKRFNQYLDYLLKLSAGKTSDAEFDQYAAKSVKVKRAVFGDGYETMNALYRTAEFYEQNRFYREAETFYLESVAAFDRLPRGTNVGSTDVVMKYRVFLLRRLGAEGAQKDFEFMKKRTAGMFERGETSGILNGSAISLPSPAYPATARDMRASGAVKVEITISAGGDVVEAKAVSGNPILQDSAERAARAAKFLPTYVNGAPVEIKGVVVYNFYPQ
jgi:TonB family protein